MSTLKYALGSTMASAALFLAPAVPVAAEGHDGGNVGSFNNTSTNTETKTINIGQCSVRFDDIKTWLDQNGNDQESNNENEVEGSVNEDNTGSNSSSQSQSNGQSVVITVSPNCSVTNVTNAAAPVVAGAQAEAAKGGVGAGVGGFASSLAASVGAVGSVLGAGFGLRRFHN